MLVLDIVKRLKLIISNLSNTHVLRTEFGMIGSNCTLEYPCHVESPSNVEIEENVNIRYGLQIINSKTEHVVIKRNTTLAPNVTIVTNNHVPTVGVPIFLLTSSHVNDKSTDVVIEEDCWVGTGAKLLSGSRLGRGCIVGAGSIVTKEVPPYAVVAGIPAKIIAARFTKEQILEHEAILYSEENRLSISFVNKIFESFFDGLKTIGKPAITDEKMLGLIENIEGLKHYIKEMQPNG